MTNALMLRGARQLLTLRGPSEPRRGSLLSELGIIEDGAVLIRDGLISSVGPTRRVENLREAWSAEVVDVTGRVVLPGLVDSHTHLIPSSCPLLARCPLACAGRAGGTQATEIGVPLAGRVGSARRLQLAARRYLENFARHGATAVEIKVSLGESAGETLRGLKVAKSLDGDPLTVISTLGITERGVANAGGVENFCAQLLPGIRKRRLASFLDITATPEDCDYDQLRKLAQRASELGFMIKLHAGHFPGDRTVQLAIEAGAVSADGLLFVTAEQVAALASSTTIATLLPGEAFHSASGRYGPARALIDAGAAVALASGFEPWSCPTYNLAAVVSLACSEMGMTPEEAIAAATINAAYALGLGDRLGSLEPGKQADLVVFDAADYREIPHHFGLNLVSMVIKRGAILYRRGEIEWERA